MRNDFLEIFKHYSEKNIEHSEYDDYKVGDFNDVAESQLPWVVAEIEKKKDDIYFIEEKK